MKFRRKNKPKCRQHEMCSKSTWTLRISKPHSFIPTISRLDSITRFRNRCQCLNICLSCEPVRLIYLWFHPALLQLFSFSSKWTEQGAFGHNLNSKCAENCCFQRKQNTWEKAMDYNVNRDISKIFDSVSVTYHPWPSRRPG